MQADIGLTGAHKRGCYTNNPLNRVCLEDELALRGTTKDLTNAPSILSSSLLTIVEDLS
jgi:hypothetical protein